MFGLELCTVSALWLFAISSVLTISHTSPDPLLTHSSAGNLELQISPALPVSILLAFGHPSYYQNARSGSKDTLANDVSSASFASLRTLSVVMLL